MINATIMNPGLFLIFSILFILFSVISYLTGVWMTKKLLIGEHNTFGNIFIDDRMFVEAPSKTRVDKAHDTLSYVKYPKTQAIRAACEEYIGVCLSEVDKEDKHDSYLARQHLDEQLQNYHQMRREAVAFQQLQARSPYKIAGI